MGWKRTYISTRPLPVGNPRGGFCSQYQDVYDAMTTAPTYAVEQNQLVVDLVNDGIWAKLDYLNVYANSTNGDGEALLNWKNPAGGSRMNTSACVNSGGTPYDSFTAQGTDGYDAVADGVSGNEIAGSADELSVTSGKYYRVTFDATLNSGSLPTSGRFAATFGGTIRSNTITPNAGSNEHFLLANGTDTVVFQMWQLNTAGDFEIRNLRVREWTNALAVNSPTFTANEGFTGNGSNMYINTRWNPSVHGSNWTQNSASVTIYSRSNVDENDFTGATEGGHFVALQLRNSNNSYGYINSNSATAKANTDSRGIFCFNRTASNAGENFRNASSLGAWTDASTGEPNDDFEVLSYGGGSFSTRQLSMIAMGSGLTSGDITNFKTRFEAYMDAMGKGVI